MDAFHHTLAYNVRLLRGKLTQRDYAAKLGVSHATINRIEQGEQNITLETLALLCERLQRRPDEILLKKLDISDN